jgi:hypothetical protein
MATRDILALGGADDRTRSTHAGLVVIHTVAALPVVAPLGGIRPALGTNPIAFGFPTDGDRVVINKGSRATWEPTCSSGPVSARRSQQVSRSGPRQTGTAEIRIPGERSYATRARSCARGDRDRSEDRQYARTPRRRRPLSRRLKATPRPIRNRLASDARWRHRSPPSNESLSP